MVYIFGGLCLTSDGIPIHPNNVVAGKEAKVLPPPTPPAQAEFPPSGPSAAESPSLVWGPPP